jgi:hypothetical protein
MSPFGHGVVRSVVSTRYVGHGVQHRPKVTENGHTERGNPPGALSDEAGAGDQAASPGGVGCPKKPRPRVMPGYADVGPVHEKAQEQERVRVLGTRRWRSEDRTKVQL